MFYSDCKDKHAKAKFGLRKQKARFKEAGPIKLFRCLWTVVRGPELITVMISLKRTHFRNTQVF